MMKATKSRYPRRLDNGRGGPTVRRGGLPPSSPVDSEEDDERHPADPPQFGMGRRLYVPRGQLGTNELGNMPTHVYAAHRQAEFVRRFHFQEDQARNKDAPPPPPSKQHQPQAEGGSNLLSRPRPRRRRASKLATAPVVAAQENVVPATSTHSGRPAPHSAAAAASDWSPPPLSLGEQDRVFRTDSELSTPSMTPTSTTRLAETATTATQRQTRGHHLQAAATRHPESHPVQSHLLPTSANQPAMPPSNRRVVNGQLPATAFTVDQVMHRAEFNSPLLPTAGYTAAASELPGPPEPRDTTATNTATKLRQNDPYSSLASGLHFSQGISLTDKVPPGLTFLLQEKNQQELVDQAMHVVSRSPIPSRKQIPSPALNFATPGLRRPGTPPPHAGSPTPSAAGSTGSRPSTPPPADSIPMQDFMEFHGAWNGSVNVWWLNSLALGEDTTTQEEGAGVLKTNISSSSSHDSPWMKVLLPLMNDPHLQLRIGGTDFQDSDSVVCAMIYTITGVMPLFLNRLGRGGLIRICVRTPAEVQAVLQWNHSVIVSPFGDRQRLAYVQPSADPEVSYLRQAELFNLRASLKADRIITRRNFPCHPMAVDMWETGRNFVPTIYGLQNVDHVKDQSQLFPEDEASHALWRRRHSK